MTGRRAPVLNSPVTASAMPRTHSSTSNSPFYRVAALADISAPEDGTPGTLSLVTG